MNPTILAIESSCDETSAAVMRGGSLLSNIVSSQLQHGEFGGVIPELASRLHQQAIMRVTPDQVDMLLHPQFNSDTKDSAIAAGNRLVEKAVNASPGAAVGIAAFDADTAQKWHNEGKAVNVTCGEPTNKIRVSRF